MVELFCVFYVTWVEYIADFFQNERRSKLVISCIKKRQNRSRMLRNLLMHNFRFQGLVVSHVEAVAVFSAHCISDL